MDPLKQADKEVVKALLRIAADFDRSMVDIELSHGEYVMDAVVTIRARALEQARLIRTKTEERARKIG